METPALVSNNCPDSYAREALEEELFGLMADAYLYSRHEFASTASRIYRSGRIVRKAEECFMAAGGRPVSLADLCAAAGVSKSKLYLAFHNMCGESPLAYFHKRRLIRARSILLNATPARGAVKRAALSVGLTELGRFSVEYRRLFGEKPSTTLRNTDWLAEIYRRAMAAGWGFAWTWRSPQCYNRCQVRLAKVTNKDTDAVINTLIRHARKLPGELYKTLTWDRGKEMTDHQRFTLATDVKVYFCDPQSHWQRGPNENTNGLLRQYFPKGTDLSVHSQAKLNAVARQLNERPRKTLGFETPAERFNQCVASTG